MREVLMGVTTRLPSDPAARDRLREAQAAEARTIGEFYAAAERVRLAGEALAAAERDLGAAAAGVIAGSGPDRAAILLGMTPAELRTMAKAAGR
jgi:hypothetical protein